MKRLLGLVLAMAALPSVAEVSVTHPAGGGTELFFEAAETGPWARVRPDAPAADLLHAQGDARADGWPSFAVRADGLPSVAYSTAGDAGEVWLAWHDGASWRPAMNVSERAGADFAPSVVLDAWNNRFVAWNNTRGSRVSVMFVGVRNDGTDKTGVAELTARQRDGRKPSLGAFGDDVYVAYEDHANGVDDVPYIAIDRVMPDRDPDRSLHCSGENTPDLSRSATIRTALTDRDLVGEPEVNVEDGELWVTWIDSRTRVGWVELTGPGTFSEPAYRPYDPNLGPDSILEDIRNEILAP